MQAGLLVLGWRQDVLRALSRFRQLETAADLWKICPINTLNATFTYKDNRWILLLCFRFNYLLDNNTVRNAAGDGGNAP